MMSLRRLDEQGMRDYLEELRPRFVTLRLTTGKIRIWWGMPLWAFEEVLSFGLRLLPLLPHLTPLLPTGRLPIRARGPGCVADFQYGRADGGRHDASYPNGGAICYACLAENRSCRSTPARYRSRGGLNRQI